MFDSYKALQSLTLHRSSSVVVEAIGIAFVLFGRHKEIEAGVLEEGDLQGVQLLQLNSSTIFIFPKSTL